MMDLNKARWDSEREEQNERVSVYYSRYLE